MVKRETVADGIVAAAREIASTAALRDAMERMQASVEEGRGLSAALADTEFIPPLAREIIKWYLKNGIQKFLTTVPSQYLEKISIKSF